MKFKLRLIKFYNHNNKIFAIMKKNEKMKIFTLDDKNFNI